MRNAFLYQQDCCDNVYSMVWNLRLAVCNAEQLTYEVGDLQLRVVCVIHNKRRVSVAMLPLFSTQ